MSTENDAETPAPEEPVVKPTAPKSGSLLAGLALLIAVGALGTSAYLFNELRTLEIPAPEVTESPPHDHDDVSQQLESLEGTAKSNEDEIKALQRAQSGTDRRFDELGALGDRIRATEQNLENLQGVSDSARQTWVLAEAQYYLQSANTRLQLARDVKTALLALRAADDRLSALGDPALYRVRELVADEIVSLESLPDQDFAGMALQLASLGQRVRELPVNNPLPELEKQITSDEPAESETGVDRAMEKVWGSVKGLVTVRKTDENITPLMTQEDEALLLRNLELQLQVARLSLLQRRQEEFRSNLSAARQWLNAHFDVSDTKVRNTIEKLTEMESVDIDPELPDISGSLKALRAMQSNVQ